MKNKHASSLILNPLYEHYYQSLQTSNNQFFPMAFNELKTSLLSEDLSEQEFIEGINELRIRGLISESIGIIYITSAGIAAYEEINPLPEVVTKEHRNRQISLLMQLGEWLYNNPNNFRSNWDYVVANATEDPLRDHYFNELQGKGLVEIGAMRELKITSSGWSLIDRIKRQIKRKDTLRVLEDGNKVTRQKRGHELEQLIFNVTRDEGWECQANVRARGEENDLIIHQGTQFFIVQCKWIAKSVQSSYIGGLSGRLDLRIGVDGIFFSMSGFTAAAVEAATNRSGKAKLILFGPEDIRQMITGESSFTEQIENKIRNLIYYRTMPWS